MNRITPQFMFGLAISLLLAAAPRTVQGQLEDQIFGPKGVPIKGTVIRTTKSHVEVRTGGQMKTMTVDEIRKIDFASDPEELSRARQLVLAGKNQEAREQLRAIDLNSIKLDLIKQDIQFYAARVTANLALQGQANMGDAVRQMVSFADDPKNQDSFHYFEAIRTIGDLAFTMGRFDIAEDKYSQLFVAPGTEIKVGARLRVADCQLALEKYAEASTTYDQVISVDLSGYENGEIQQMIAKIGKAVCQAASGEVDAAAQSIEDIIIKGDPSNITLFARAYNGLGTCYLKAGKPQEALMAFLRTDVLFYKDPDAHAEALYHLSKLWQQIRKPDRAVKDQQRLKSRYGGTLWARKE